MTLQRTESFVPLTVAPSAGARADHRVVVVAAGGDKAAFRPLNLEATPAAPAPAPAAACEPRISLAREGDRVVSIRVQCSCGQVMDLACVYPEAQ